MSSVYHISLRRFLANLQTPVNLFKARFMKSVDLSTHKNQITKKKSEKRNKSHKQKEWEEEARKPHKDFHLLQLRKDITLENSSHFFATLLDSTIFEGFLNKNVTFHIFERCFWSLQTFLKKQVIRISVSKHLLNKYFSLF